MRELEAWTFSFPQPFYISFWSLKKKMEFLVTVNPMNHHGRPQPTGESANRTLTQAEPGAPSPHPARTTQQQIPHLSTWSHLPFKHSSGLSHPAKLKTSPVMGQGPTTLIETQISTLHFCALPSELRSRRFLVLSQRFLKLPNKIRGVGVG